MYVDDVNHNKEKYRVEILYTDSVPMSRNVIFCNEISREGDYLFAWHGNNYNDYETICLKHVYHIRTKEAE